ncbi:SUF system NifU family Fe-S cluster assembly protein [Clostridium tyrobutyricum]|jgi:nitrogen fixation NifU-like protein|uniref:Putative iron-sulfur cluster assembly scaffold protein for SUF system, SufE2 n=1 Tax=Clostridium tyrobutyricum DIVETGP TaxID=1408889 RepID=W6NGH2_CLOTY|nr:SUF system NifU family Fe-S cluster assembly protein [Clostridium tyrobutyricum]AND84473.1 Zn-dependent sulfurtransferase SufU [Clostridium tyrobutyricum]ANP69088.1 SUF system NifU family Fe-S cluster assembly protein [Clostridium tyrobutyricum]MBV4416734.1 SUF system NifU family Fe-S cluster assembly protein [Clostridium tyrobutyricum]MBV4422774.1 SUF system NifU family Fe-S cluster assembly protein [Clostridium tyrobutyricum]MBV4425920.1 SUF system NifU family Fe-S cluster assembly protei
MDDLSLIYSEIITEHNQDTTNKRKIEDPDIKERGHNPSCGDDITLSLKFNGDIIEDVAYEGSGCAISQASTSMMIDLIKGKTIEEAMDYVNTFIGMIKKKVTDEKQLEKLEDAIALKNISMMPARVKCAVLAWHTLDEAIKKKNVEKIPSQK